MMLLFLVATVGVFIRITGFTAAFQGSWILIISVAFSDIIITGFVFLGILLLNNLKERSLQTLTAIFGVSTILSLIQLPLYFVTDGITLDEASPMTLLILFVIDIWTLAVIAWIMKNALDTSIGIGVLVSIVGNFASKILLLSIYPNFFFPTT